MLKLIESKQDINKFILKFGDERYNTLQRCKSKIYSPEYKDLTWITAHLEPDELDKILDKYYTRQQRIEDDIKRVCAMKEADDVDKFENNGITFYRINTPEASVKYGLSVGGKAGWCISGGYYDGDRDGEFRGVLDEAEYYYEDYLYSHYEEYYFAFTPDGEKYAICVLQGGEDCDIYNREDEKIGNDITDSQTGEVIFSLPDKNENYPWNNNPIWAGNIKSKSAKAASIDDGVWSDTIKTKTGAGRITKITESDYLIESGAWQGYAAKIIPDSTLQVLLPGICKRFFVTALTCNLLKIGDSIIKGYVRTNNAKEYLVRLGAKTEEMSHEDCADEFLFVLRQEPNFLTAKAEASRCIDLENCMEEIIATYRIRGHSFEDIIVDFPPLASYMRVMEEDMPNLESDIRYPRMSLVVYKLENPMHFGVKYE